MARRLLAAAATALLLGGCKHDLNRPEIPRVAARLQEYSARLLAMDPAPIAAMFAPEGEMVNPRQPPVHGRAAIQKFLAGFADYRVLANTDTTESIAVDGGNAELLGSYEQKVRAPDGQVFATKGRLEVTWTRAPGGEWLILQLETFPAK